MPTDTTLSRQSSALGLEQKIKRLQGPILVLGGSGFIGANLFRMVLKHRDDVYGTTSRLPAWRLEGLPARNVRVVDLLVDSNLDHLLDDIKPLTIFNCVAYGAYSFETDSQLIYQTNFNFTHKLLARLESRTVAAYAHAGSSSEYGDNAAGPAETDPLGPNSDYAVSKAASANLLHFYGKRKRLPCANLRLYSVYGPMEDSSRLIPNLIINGVEGRYPEFVSPDISRDFVYVDDVCEAFIAAALNLEESDYGESFNIGDGLKTTIGEVAAIAAELFNIQERPNFSMPNRGWDVPDWYANIEKARGRLKWQPRTDFRDGLASTIEWYRSLPDKEKYYRSSKKFGLDTKHSVSAIVSCHGDSTGITSMYDRLKATFTKLNIDYEIVFVDDCSQSDTEEVMRALSMNDRRVVGISHSRDFGSQAAFRSGMEIASKNACVLLDCNLQDPPELIEQFVEKWREGYDVVYGRLTRREGPHLALFAERLFYKVFNYFSYLSIPGDAGDFALLDKKVVGALLQFPERDVFLRGLRAFAGFQQVGVDYTRAKTEPGKRERNLIKKISWAKKGILSFSNIPLNILSLFGIVLLLITFLLGAAQVAIRLLFPGLSVQGITTILLAILFFGSLNLLAIGLLGEYIARIFEEVKQRPHFVRRSIIKDGEVRPANDVVTHL